MSPGSANRLIKESANTLISRFMKQVHYTVRGAILRVIDLFYPPSAAL
jgi:hypothetical protein